ncbi:MAG: hypothetical protein JNK48_12245 [Bryobacterales bacterium]|nr:hypothetical protein [Bryobacterales bacterium]
MRTRLLTGFLATVLAASCQEVEIVTRDIENFWRAYDTSEPGARTEAFQRIYFDQASPGLRDFIRLRIGSAAQLAATVDRFPRFYRSIRKATESIENHRKVLNLYAERFRGLHPEAKFPTVYFLIGRLSSGGTVGDSGLLIGTEVFSLGPDVDASEIQEQSPTFFRAMGSSHQLPQIVIHELVHAQVELRVQPRIPNLMTITLLEGAADFIANLVTGRTGAKARADFGQANRDDLFERFRKDLIATPNSTDGWLYNYATAKDEADLGYWIGEEICRDYLARSVDKQAALRNILTLLDPEAIVRGSSFAYLLP